MSKIQMPLKIATTPSKSQKGVGRYLEFHRDEQVPQQNRLDCLLILLTWIKIRAVMTRLVLVLGILAVGAAHAVASFDLSLIPQASSGRVNRHDPSNGVGLGSFSAPGATNVTLDQAGGRVFVSSGTSTNLRSYNYSTGEFLNTHAMGLIPGQFSYNSAQNSIFMVTATGGIIQRVNLATGTVTSISGASGVTWRSVMTAGNVATFMGTDASARVVMQSFDATTLGSTDFLNTAAVALPGTRMGKGLLTVRGAGLFYAFAFINALSGISFVSGDATDTGFVTNVTTLELNGFGNAVTPSAMAGHNGFYFLGHDSASTTTMRVNGYAYNRDLVSVSTATGYSFSDSNFGAANIVAPEPASMIALGAGALALVRRRRKS